MFDARHVCGADFNCLDCAEPWPCPGYQDLVCSLFEGDMSLVTVFMRFFLPQARMALSGLSRGAVEARVVGWCQLRRPVSSPGLAISYSPRVTSRPPWRAATELVGVKGAG